LDTFRVSWERDTVRLHGELDLAPAGDFEADFRRHLNGQQSLVIDLAELTFIDSTGIRTLIRIAQAASPRSIVLRSPQASVRRVFELTRLDQSLDNVIVEP
jgi:anti-anti-sigma factor